ncbi:hypothetical protein [Marinobacter psychrophilus]|uniref:hypothetical protein n=1 Tax=Marinobacter psychrophilus TaxID=330734 RepID=UPI001B6A66D1|nr:hypothetical protein [Marinobacter psychrophilus]MBQ0762071.1 hypothetical protein [Marinobacter psychrophilus]MBQ0843645.1 hypothetical protein [Marinobacter psychrophilus]
MKQLLIAFFMISGLSVHAFANDEALAITPQQTFDLVQTQPDQMLFVDVRDPIEIMFIGFTNVKYIDNGFQGSSAKEGEKAGMRIVNGWQNDGLPWSMKINPGKIYRSGQ